MTDLTGISNNLKYYKVETDSEIDTDPDTDTDTDLNIDFDNNLSFNKKIINNKCSLKRNANSIHNLDTINQIVHNMMYQELRTFNLLNKFTILVLKMINIEKTKIIKKLNKFQIKENIYNKNVIKRLSFNLSMCIINDKCNNNNMNSKQSKLLKYNDFSNSNTFKLLSILYILLLYIIRFYFKLF